jgi:hypothetical protein
MCQVIDENKTILGYLMLELGSFTEEEITEELKKRLGERPLELDPFWNIHRYLNEYNETGILTFKHGKYHLGWVWDVARKLAS